jgi:hypothetical protein
MSQHQTRSMASIAGFECIVGAILSQKADSPLFKAFEKSGISTVGDITSLTDQAINLIHPLTKSWTLAANNSSALSTHLSKQRRTKGIRSDPGRLAECRRQSRVSNFESSVLLSTSERTKL